ncbi:translation release factor [Schizopora paradoxa]|uniref:Eukaryotic peptide chain release factor subunit 1 n=1 Tax=Schizopora paradoxa TaxID=27342 RepID=A0A0H2S5U9_9AGAM|nr:translation release factor [Schizopora paradoxa]
MNSPDQNIQLWKTKRLIKRLGDAKGEGTSLITLILPPKSSLSQARHNLNSEYGKASNIKSHVNMLSVRSAIKTTQQRLKLFNQVPPNGLVVYAGTIHTTEGKERKISEHIMPPKPINISMYRYSKMFGFIVMDGNGTLFGTLSGNTRTVLRKLTVSLPNKHGRGGQSALRFSRLRDESRRNYIRKVAELAIEHFISSDKVNVEGLVLAGSADFKNDLNGSGLFDQRLAAKVVKVVDVSYGGENGFNQAIKLAADSLANVRFVQETRLLQKYFDEINMNTGKYCFGIDDTLEALNMGAVETLIVWENLEVTRYTLTNAAGDEIIKCLIKEDEKSREKLFDPSTSTEMQQAAEPQPLVEWLAENYKSFGAKLELISDCSQEGTQFVKGFGGIGGILRYKVDFSVFDDGEEEFYSGDEDN